MAKKQKTAEQVRDDYEAVQPVFMGIKELRTIVTNMRAQATNQTQSLAFERLVEIIRNLERLALIARSGPGIIEELRKEGHDV